MTSTNAMLRFSPQMETYRHFNITREYRPFMMFVQKRNYHSSVVNTDEYGVRFSVDQKGRFGLNGGGCSSCNLIVGNSVAFGVGSTTDAMTVSSRLSCQGERWINLTGTGYTGWQELMMFLAYREYLPPIRRVVILSGINDLYLSFAPRLFDPMFGPVSHGERFSGEFEVAGSGRAEVLSQLIGRFVRLFDKPRRPDPGADMLERWEKREVVLPPIRKTLSVWSDLARAGNFELIYALQPIEGFITRSPSQEESELFSFFDSRPSYAHHLAKLVLTKERYRWFLPSISSICHDHHVRFLDLNDGFPENGWHFIDRIHLTDLGQQVTSEMILNRLNKS